MTALLALFLALQDQDPDKGFLGLREGQAVLYDEAQSVTLTISGLLDFEHYEFEEDAPGLLFYKRDDGYRSNPRLSVFLDLQVEERIYFFLQARGDRGFDPNYMDMMDVYQARIDELFGRYTFFQDDDATLALQVGKFATPLGNFVPRHDSMHNPFVRAPLPYDHVTTVGDGAISGGAPPNNQAFINRRDIDDLKHRWVTMLWGPVYHSGAMLFGTLGRFDARVAFVNAAPGERPLEWDRERLDFATFNVSARVGWNPFLGFRAGLNFSVGPYLSERFPSATVEVENFDQTLVGLDLEYGIGHLTMFAELWRSEWEVPGVTDDVEAFAWTVEAKYKLSDLVPGLYVAARLGQIFANDIANATGHETPWERTSFRAEFGVGWFVYVNLLVKAQYELNHTNGPNDPDDDMASFSLSLSF